LSEAVADVVVSATSQRRMAKACDVVADVVDERWGRWKSDVIERVIVMSRV